MKHSIEWAAGLFEGEGSIVVRPERNSIQLTVYSTDRDVLEMFLEAVEVGSIKGPRKREPHKDMWEWHAYSTNARLVLEALLPHLGTRRLAKATEALAIRGKRSRAA